MASSSSSALQDRLKAQQDSSLLQLSDCFIGDAGCHALLQFCREKRPRLVTALELRGNNIGGPGAMALADCIALLPSLKRLELEWNELGRSDPGLQALCEAIASHTELENISLKNNKIPAESASHFADMIRNSASLHIVDLRWNALSASGGSIIVKALKQNTALISLELGGNHIPQDIMAQVDAMLKKNRDFQGMPQDVERTPLRMVHRPENYHDADYRLSPVGSRGLVATPDSWIPPQARDMGGAGAGAGAGASSFRGDDFVLQLKAKAEGYGLQMARNDRKMKAVGRQLEVGFGAGAVQDDLGKQIAGERVEREQAMAMLGRLRDEQTRKELKGENQRRTLQQQLEESEREADVLGQERRQVEAAHAEVEAVMTEKLTELENSLKEVQKDGRVKNETLRAKLQVERKTRQDESQAAQTEWTKKLNDLEEKVTNTQSAQEALDAENRELNKEILSLKLQHEEQLVEARRKVAQADKQKSEALLHSLQQKVQLLSQSRQQYTTRLQQQAREAHATEREQTAAINQLEREAALLQEQLVLEKKKREMAHLEHGRLQAELGAKRGALEKIQADREEVRRGLAQQQTSHLAALKASKEEAEGEKAGQDGRLKELQAKIRSLEKRLAELQRELQELELADRNLPDQVSLAVAQAVRGTLA